MKKLFTAENMATFGLTVVALLIALVIWPHVKKFVPGTAKVTTATTTTTP